MVPPDTIWVLSGTPLVAVAKRFVAVLSLICLMGGCFRDDLGALCETCVAQIRAWRVRVKGLCLGLVWLGFHGILAPETIG